jgi:cytochrome c-type biogenesis protein CcmH
MTLFWSIGAALAAAALALILRPLVWRRPTVTTSRDAANLAIYRDQLRELDADLAAGKIAQADHARARIELEARVLEDASSSSPDRHSGARSKGLALAAGTAIPALAVVLYLLVGSPSAVDRPAGEHALTAQQVEAMVERLAGRLRENPDDVEGWRLLGRSYGALGRFGDAAQAYAQAARRAPRDAQLLVDFADVLAMAQGRTLEGEPEKLVLRALEIDPANLKALALAGTAAFARADYAGAVRYWERMLAHVTPGSEDARTIQSNVDEARALVTKNASSEASVRGTVRIAPRLKDKIRPDDTVFIFARAADGPPMPLAVVRKRARDLPAAFSLDDTMAMTPQMKLSSFERIVVGARVSRSGNATPQPGDLQGASAPVANRAEGVSVVIDGVVK